jgi:prenyltransferase beta subunit
MDKVRKEGIKNSAVKLYDFIFENFWEDNAITGPDPGLMFNLRVFRFVNSYLHRFSRVKRYYFLQAQAYWVKDNWALFNLTGISKYRDVAISCSNRILSCQESDGSWNYPLKEWSNYVSTVEGVWASLSLLESYSQTSDKSYLDAALKWYDFLINKTGFQEFEDSLSINYLAFSKKDRKVPNNATLALWFFSELFNVTKDARFLKFNDKLIGFLELCQKPNGELIYEVGKEHYLCYHYNSFELLDLLHCYNITQSSRVKSVIENLAKFVASGVTENGTVKYSCSQEFPEYIVFSSVAAAALLGATNIGLGNYQDEINKLYSYILENQKENGSFILSRHDMVYVRNPVNWGFLTDRTPYPRQMSYILHHLLIGIDPQTVLN